jgi:hypothetical protein
MNRDYYWDDELDAWGDYPLRSAHTGSQVGWIVPPNSKSIDTIPISTKWRYVLLKNYENRRLHGKRPDHVYKEDITGIADTKEQAMAIMDLLI